VIRYALIFIAVLVTPFLAQPIAKLFDWAVLSWSQEGQLRPLFVELFTAIFWLAEWIGFCFLDKYLKKRFALENKDTLAKNQENSEALSAAAVGDVTETNEAIKENADKKRKKKREPFFEKTPLLPLKNVVILFLIAAACIVVVTLQIGFKVKPFYELGDKTTYSQILIKGGEVLRNLAKGIWIVCILKTSLSLMEELSKNWQMAEKHAKLLKWLSVGALSILFGVLDIILFANPFVWTYILFYAVFTAVYFFTNQAAVKSYLLICFIYIF
jgi:hypothetical protein